MREFYKSDKATQNNKAGPDWYSDGPLEIGVWRGPDGRVAGGGLTVALAAMGIAVKAYTSNWGEHKVGVIDLKQMISLKEGKGGASH